MHGRWREKGGRRVGLRGPAVAATVLLTMLFGPAAAAAAEESETSASTPQTRYSLVHNCYALKSVATGKYVAQQAGGYVATSNLAGAEKFRMQATDLGRYLFFGLDKDFISTSASAVTSETEPSNGADWKVTGAGTPFTITNSFVGRDLAVNGSGKLVPVAAGSGGGAATYAFEEADGCPKYPEIRTNVKGAPSTGFPRYGETQGLVEGHMHHMAFEFLGGRAHCGRPWHRFGAPYALVDCPDHTADHSGAVLENAVSGDSVVQSTDGWPTFEGWPDDKSLTHEGSYYKWVERSWLAGERIFVNLLVENRVLCEIYPLKKNSCDEMDGVRLQAQRMYELQDYIDAQSGGPGEGWYRIVKSPFAARRVINDGKLAVIMGMEVSEPFGCRLRPPNATPACDRADIDRELKEIHKLGVRQLELTNKFDNALVGVAGDDGQTGAVTNAGNFISTGRYIDYEHCDDEVNSDREPLSAHHNDDDLIGNGLEALLPPGAAPIYPPPPLCNRLALSSLGTYAIRRIMEKKMIFDPDHMGVYGRDQALSLLESEDYSGVISSHSWSTESALSRIYKLGGIITPYAGDSESFAEQWKGLREDDIEKLGKQYFGLGFGADQNGLGSQGGPRGGDVPNPVTYPFRNWNGDLKVLPQRSGTRTYDINTDGVDHYGLYPDWVEDLRMIAGDRIVNDLGRGSEAYLQMWERAEGVPKVRCPSWNGDITDRGIGHNLRIGKAYKRVLYRAGQPVDRQRAWKWCTRNRKGGKRELGGRRNIIGVFDTKGKLRFVASTLQRNQADGIGRGSRVAELRGRAEKIGRGLWIRSGPGGSTFVYGTKGRKVSFAGVADSSISRQSQLRRYVKRSGLA